MNWKEVNSLNQLLNKEDIALIDQVRRKLKGKLVPDIFLLTFLLAGTFTIMAFLGFPKFSWIIVVVISFIMVMVILLPRMQRKIIINVWEKFLEDKSIIFATRDFSGYKSAIEDHISRDKNYYTDDRSIDRRAF